MDTVFIYSNCILGGYMNWNDHKTPLTDFAKVGEFMGSYKNFDLALKNGISPFELISGLSMLHPIRIMANKPFFFTSYYRPEDKGSAHGQGKAIDFQIGGFRYKEYAQLILDLHKTNCPFGRLFWERKYRIHVGWIDWLHFDWDFQRPGLGYKPFREIWLARPSKDGAFPVARQSIGKYYRMQPEDFTVQFLEKTRECL